MKVAIIVMILTFVGGCSISLQASDKTTRSRILDSINYIGFSTSATSLALDGCQTATMASNWGNYHEGGIPTRLFIGDHPSTTAVGVYFSAVALTLLGGTQLISKERRPWVYLAITAIESAVVIANSKTCICSL